MGLGLLVFAGLAALTAVAWWRMHTRDRATLDRWAQEEEELSDAPDVFHWDEHLEDSDAWKGDRDSDD